MPLGGAVADRPASPIGLRRLDPAIVSPGADVGAAVDRVPPRTTRASTRAISSRLTSLAGCLICGPGARCSQSRR